MNKQKNERLPFKTVMAYSRRGFAIWWKAEPEILIAAAVQRAVEAARGTDGQVEPLGFSIIRKEDIYGSENQKLLFPVTS